MCKNDLIGKKSLSLLKMHFLHTVPIYTYILKVKNVGSCFLQEECGFT